MAQEPWYETFFGQRYLDAYRSVLTLERTLREADFIERALAPAPGARILDLCCGHGRHAVELAARGYVVTGIDLDQGFLDLAQTEAAKRGVRLRLERRDMRNIGADGAYDAVINMFTAFGYLESDEEDQRVLDGVAQALTPGGRFLIELMPRDALVRRYLPRDWHRTDEGTIVLEERAFDPASGRNTARQTTIYPDGTRVETSAVLRFYTLTELTAMRGRAGLVVEESFGGVFGGAFESPYTLDSQRLAIVARKPAGG